jgi:hypothetical protein
MSYPIVYSTVGLKNSGKGPLPGYPYQTWETLNQYVINAKNLITQPYLAYLNADLAGDAVAKQAAIESMNTILSDYASSIPGFTVRFYVENNQSVIRASSIPESVGSTEYGRTEIIVAQQNTSIIANCARTSSTTTQFTYYSALALGNFSCTSGFPAHILKGGFNQ